MYANEIDAAQRHLHEVAAARNRPLFKGPPKTKAQEQRREVMRQNRVLLRARTELYEKADCWAFREVWDVVKVASGEHRLYAKGLLFFGEAVALAQACMSGQTFVSLAGARALLTAGQNSSFAMPSRDLSPGKRFHLVSQDGASVGRGAKVVEMVPGVPKVVLPEKST